MTSSSTVVASWMNRFFSVWNSYAIEFYFTQCKKKDKQGVQRSRNSVNINILVLVYHEIHYLWSGLTETEKELGVTNGTSYFPHPQIFEKCSLSIYPMTLQLCLSLPYIIRDFNLLLTNSWIYLPKLLSSIANDGSTSFTN